MQLSNSTSLPNAVISWMTPILSHFNFLSEKTVSAIDYYVAPVGGDVSFVILKQGDEIYALITTDYPEPLQDSDQLQQLSKQKYSFGNVITPTGELVSAADIDSDKFLGNFFVKIDSTYYYCAEI